MCESGNCPTCEDNLTCNWEGRLYKENEADTWRLLLSWEMSDGTIITYDDYQDWLMIADYFTVE